MEGRGDSGRGDLGEVKRQLVKTARMYAMCRKAGVSEPMDVAGLALAAFEDMPLKQAMVFVRSNERNIEDLAWAFENSDSAEEFEQRVKQIKDLPGSRAVAPRDEKVPSRLFDALDRPHI